MSTSVRFYLESLGSTGREVADRLRALGIKGRIGSPGDCPIARALKKQGWDGIEISADGSWTEYAMRWGYAMHYGTTRYKEALQEGKCPPAIREFVRAFDSGFYIDLKA